MARDIETYLRELQAALASAGADPALVQDALFDAEEHLQSEMAAGGDFTTVTEEYGSPEEVAAAYLGTVPVQQAARAMNGQTLAVPATGAAVGAGASALTGEASQTSEAPAVVAAQPEPLSGPALVIGSEPLTGTAAMDDQAAALSAPRSEPTQAPEEVKPSCAHCGTETTPGQAFCRNCGAPVRQPGYLPTGVQQGMQAAGAGFAPRHSVWWEIFGPFADSRVWTSLVYMLLSLGTGIVYFTVVVTGLSTAGGMLILIVGIPLMFLVLGIVRAMALFEGRLVEVLLGTRMPRRLRPDPPGAGFLQRMLFWLKDGRTWASMAYMLLMLPLGIVYFTVAVTGLSVGLGLVTTPFWAWAGRFANQTFMVDGVTYHWWFPAWGIPLSFIGGVIVLVGMMHLIKWIGRGHAAFAKAMLVRLAK